VVNEPKLTITAAGSTQICSGGSVVLTAGEAESYQWYKYGIALAGAQSQTYTAISEGVFTVSRRSNTGCLSQQSEGILVTVAAMPVQPLLYTEKRSICAGDSAVLIAGAPAPLQWFRDDVLIDGRTDYTLVVKETGVYSVKSVSASGCAGLKSNPVLLQVLDRPDQPSVELIQPDCFNRGIIKIKSPLASGYLYSIDGVTYTNTSGSFIGMADGTYHVAVKAANGCVSKHTQVTIESTPINDTLLTITPGSSTQLCPGGSVVLTASNAGTYQWYQNGIAVAGANMQTYTVSGDGVFAVSRRNEGRCIYPQSMGVPVRIVQPPAAPVIAAPKQLICAGETIVIQSSQAFALQWFRNGQPIAGANAVQLQVQASGTYVAQAANSAGCSSTFSNPVVVTVIDLPVTPVLEIDGTTQFCKDETRLLKVKSIPPAHTIQWFRNNTLIPGVFSDTLRINDGAGYRVTLTNSNGCASTPSNTVLTAVVCVTGIYVPDVFTPNGDGINDIIKPITPGIRKFRWFRIYNRWGNLVFEAADAQKGWDGKFRGKEQPAETYIWVVEGADSRGISIKKTGMLNLVR
jgi:gliding motility-associated-like protein